MTANIRNLTKKEIKKELLNINQPEYRAKQIFKWLYESRIETFEEMTNLSKELRNILQENYSIICLSLFQKKQSKDGTVKLAFELKDKNVIEAVLIPEAKRKTLCVSSQAGCRYKCAFCLSGLSGFKRNFQVLKEILKYMK